MIRVALITVSTSRAVNNRQDAEAGKNVKPDLSGERLVALAESIDAEIVGRELIGDDFEVIVERLTHWSGSGRANLILTSGGTGFSPSDVTPEATRAVVERPAPGMAEAIRLESASHTDKWALSRNEAGIRGSCLIVNLPGIPRAIDESGPALTPILKHAIDLIEDVDGLH